MSALITQYGAPLMVGKSWLSVGSVSTAPVDPPPTNPGGDIPPGNLVGWWDGSTMGSYVDVYSIPDKSSAGKNASTAAKSVSRLAGMLGGVYSVGSATNYTVMDPVINDYVVTANAIAVGASQAFTVALVWSRPNQRQPNKGPFSTESVDLIVIGGVPLLRMSAVGLGADTLTLFPTLTPVSAGTLELRHTRSTRVVFNGSTVDVWLDNNKIITASANQITLGSTANLSFLPNAQCIFHEAAAWSKALDTSGHEALTSYLTRWPLGARYAANFFIIGQSNAALMVGNYSLMPQGRKEVAYMTGSLSANVLTEASAGESIFSGQGVYDNSGNLVLNSSGGGSPSTWPLGANGNSLMTFIDSWSADQRSNVRGILWYWSESDSLMLTYANKATYTAAMKRAFSLIRAKLGFTAAQLPFLVINALPFPTDQGIQTHREVMADLVADASQNVRFMLAQSADAVGQNDSFDPATGLESGTGNSAHRDFVGASTYLHRWVAPMARAVMDANTARGTLEPITAINASIPVTGGPRIAAARYEGTTYAATGTVLVTFIHDGGSDLIIPMRAALGVGWALMDGISSTVSGTPGSPGALIAATACVRVSAIQVRLTLVSVPSNPGKAQLYYPYGTGFDANYYALIGRGNAVTDNFSTVTLAAGWRIGQDLGLAAQPNNPVQATTYGVDLS